MGLPLKSAVTARPETISLDPDPYTDESWTLAFDTDDGNRVEVSLSPAALQELHVEARSIPTEHRAAGRSGECDRCGDPVDLFLAIPNTLGRPVHRECYAEAYAVDWVAFR